MKIILTALLFCVLFCFSVFSQDAQKVDEFGSIQCDDYLARMDNMIIQAKNNVNSRIYVLIYEGKETNYNYRKNKDELVFPTFGSAKAKINSIKKLLKQHKYFDDRFLFVEAGFREEYSVEIWLVPDGANPPEPSPTLKKMKYRKGKARGFCTSCC